MYVRLYSKRGRPHLLRAACIQRVRVWPCNELREQLIQALSVLHPVRLVREVPDPDAPAPGEGPRKLFAGDPNRPTETEKAEAYNSLVAATGTCSLSGQTLTLNALVHKNPHEMAGKPLTYTLEVDGNTLRMVIANPPFLPGREWRTVLTKVE